MRHHRQPMCCGAAWSRGGRCRAVRRVRDRSFRSRTRGRAHSASRCSASRSPWQCLVRRAPPATSGMLRCGLRVHKRRGVPEAETAGGCEDARGSVIDVEGVDAAADHACERDEPGPPVFADVPLALTLEFACRRVACTTESTLAGCQHLFLVVRREPRESLFETHLVWVPRTSLRHDDRVSVELLQEIEHRPVFLIE